VGVMCIVSGQLRGSTWDKGYRASENAWARRIQYELHYSHADLEIVRTKMDKFKLN
jgi:hypothetical protein